MPRMEDVDRLNVPVSDQPREELTGLWVIETLLFGIIFPLFLCEFFGYFPFQKSLFNNYRSVVVKIRVTTCLYDQEGSYFQILVQVSHSSSPQIPRSTGSSLPYRLALQACPTTLPPPSQPLLLEVGHR